MAYELVYTSAPEGLTRGSSGFCVVACTKGLGPRLVVTLEGLSAYKPLYPHYASNAWDNPISRSHYIYEANGEKQHILSRICFNGVDHTQRSNKLASHLVLSQREAAIANGGPSSLLLQENLFKDAAWQIKAEYFPKQKEIPATTAQIRKCSLWESIMGDAGWAGYLAQTYIDFPTKNVYIAYTPEQNKNILPLLHEAILLLPEDLRWKLTFTTYFVNLPAGMNCTWRCCPVDSEAIRAARRSPMNLIIDITKPQPLNKESELIEIARTGIVEAQEENTAEPIPEEISPKLNDTKADKIACVPKLRIALPKAELQNETLNLPLPKISHNIKSRQLDENNVAGYKNEAHSFPERKKSFLVIAAVICFLLIITGGIVYFVSVAKEKQTYIVKKDEYTKLRDACDGTKIHRDEIFRKCLHARTEKQVAALIKEIKNLKQDLESIRKAAEKLFVYQKLFEKYQQQTSSSEIFSGETPRGLIETCDAIKKELTMVLSSLNSLLERIRKQQKTTAETEKIIQKQKPVQIQTPALPEKTLPSHVQPKQLEKKAVKPAKQFSIDDPRYLWEKSDTFHKMTQNGNLDVQIGSIEPDKIRITFIPEKKEQKVGVMLLCEDANARSTRIATKFDKEQGKLSFVLKSNQAPSDKDILIKLDGEKLLPLYFRLGISQIKVLSKNLKINIENKIKITVNDSSMKIPKLFYTEMDLPCQSSPTLRLVCSSYKNIDLEKRDNQYMYEGEDTTLKELNSHLNELEAIEKEINEDPTHFARMLNEKLEKELKAYLDASDVVNDDKMRLKIDKLFNKEAKKPPTPKDLREKVKKDPKKIPDKKKKMLEWVEKYDAMQKAAELLILKLKDVPLKDLGYSSYKSSFSEEKKQADKELQAYKKDIETAIRASSVVLVYGDQEYKQFPIKDLLQ